METHRVFVCGTRAVERRGPTDYRVVCATCGAGGSARFKERELANAETMR